MLSNVFGALNQRQIRYCLLRGYEELSLASPVKEVDLLVAPDQLEDFAGIVRQFGYVALPAWGHAPHYFFVAFDKQRGSWLKLDVVTDLVYGRPIRFLRIDSSSRCLRERVSQDGIWVLSPEHEFITLLLHQVLDKGTIPEIRRQRLRSFREAADGEAALRARLETYFDKDLLSTLTWDRTSRAMDNGDWQWLLNQRTSIARTLFWRDPIGNTWRSLRNRVLRRLSPSLFMLHRHGVSIVLLAPDGAGKSTLAGTLSQDRILRAKIVYMGSNLDSTTVGLPTTGWLRKRVRSLRQHDRSPGRALLGAINFCNRLMEQWLRCLVGGYHKWTGRFVVFDRYVYDALQAPAPNTTWKRLRRALLVKTCPGPDIVVLLDAPGKILFERKGEHSPERLEKQRQVLLGLKDKLSNMIVVDATRPAEDVRREVAAIIWDHYRAQTA